ncbi:VOC family protein [Affinibrenneria salicis]|uniref:hypothetical protein n=1 Tax=Affinibrenneria salicis TaxID=2590031 RepID=UPI00295E71CC|nr:hypothetical protein [Affinibrenneria salicis]
MAGSFLHSGYGSCPRRPFYQRTLQTLGYRQIKALASTVSVGVVADYGASIDPGGDFWIFQGDVAGLPRAHFAFSAESRAQVEAFYAAARITGRRPAYSLSSPLLLRRVCSRSRRL